MSDLEAIGVCFVLFAIGESVALIIKHFRNKEDINRKLDNVLEIVEALLYVLFVIPTGGALILFTVQYIISLL